ncbi:hypothetical protein [Streptomyces sp. NPDC014733]|uniref:hypothetical protein n=1 Tax=Streptomyces sp. NPDC014733 TaxID=3364885 RepID=UPI0036FD1EC5
MRRPFFSGCPQIGGRGALLRNYDFAPDHCAATIVSSPFLRPAPPAGTVAPSGPAGPDTPDGYRRVHDAAGFTVDVPRGWRRTQRTGGVFYQSPGETSLIQIFRMTAPDETPYDALKSADRSLSGQPGYRRIRLEKTGSGKAAAAELEYAYTSPKLGPRRVLDRVLTGDEGVRYGVVLADPADRWLEQRARQEVVLRSFSAPR